MAKIFAMWERWLEHKWLWVVPVLVVILPAVWTLFWPGYFNMHDDLQMMRQLEVEKCFKDGQIPCRWVPDMGYGYGYPLFNYYPQGPYLVGEIFRIFGVSFTWTAKLLFVTVLVGAAMTMFILGRALWGGWGGLVASGFYALAPYHAVDVFVRGAMNEAWALVWFPLILWAGMEVVKRPKWKFLVWLVVGWVGLFMSHNLIAMIFAPVFVVWVGLWLALTGNWRSIKWLAAAGVWSFGLVAFFELPVIFEQRLVQIEGITSDYYNYAAHFVSLYQMLISRYWGYGGSIFGTRDTMSFQIGWLHWGLGLVVVAGMIYQLLRMRKKVRREGGAGLLLVMVAWAGAFMMHERSIVIWKLVPQLAMLQFPWRFLTLAILGFSAGVGFLVWWLPEKWRGLVSVVLIVVAMGLYGGYFRPGKYGPLTDKEKFSGEAWRKQQSASITDYLPKTVERVPVSAAGEVVEVVRGEARVEGLSWGTNWVTLVAESDMGAVLRLNIFDFPWWRVFVGGKEVEILRASEDELGRIGFRVPAGRWEVRARLFDTPVRQWGNAISLVALALLVSSRWWRPLVIKRR